jgi:hypothetical protein
MVKASRPRPRIRPSVAERGGGGGGGGGDGGGESAGGIGSGTPERPAPVKPRIGRPTVHDKRKKAIRVLTTEDEHAELKRAAADVSMSVSTWMRTLALERARQMAKKARQEERQEGHGVDSD